jgi:phosphoenolpyruvate---glycerone phosphotransferase subunit DhaL
MSAQRIRRVVDAACQAIDDNVELLTRLDQAIGDGDHGLNMKRGFTAIREAGEELARLPWSEALNKAGMLLVTKVGGASGPLYGSLLLAMGKAATQAAPDRTALVAMLAEGVAAVQKRGKSEIGEKTMLEVLVPVLGALRHGVEQGEANAALAERIARTAREGLEASRPLRASKGRASFLGERSIGHLDPGAQSSCLLVCAVCEVFGAEAT